MTQMKKIRRRIIVLCMVCVMAVGMSISSSALEVSPYDSSMKSSSALGISPFASDTKTGLIPSSGSTTWTQPSGYIAYRVSVWNKTNETMKVTITQPDGDKETYELLANENKVLVTYNNASAGKYEIDFSTKSGTLTGEYGIRWSTVGL